MPIVDPLKTMILGNTIEKCATPHTMVSTLASRSKSLGLFLRHFQARVYEKGC
jgi:hypothetical protein